MLLGVRPPQSWRLITDPDRVSGWLKHASVDPNLARTPLVGTSVPSRGGLADTFTHWTIRLSCSQLVLDVGNFPGEPAEESQNSLHGLADSS